MSIKVITKNKKAFFEYEIIERYIAGIVLTGSEIKSIRNGSVNFVDSYAYFKNNELYLKGMHIGQYKCCGYSGHDPNREKKLLLKKNELKRIKSIIEGKPYTIVPLSCFISETGYAKIEIAIVKGKKLYDKREQIKKRDMERRKNLEI